MRSLPAIALITALAAPLASVTTQAVADPAPDGARADTTVERTVEGDRRFPLRRQTIGSTDARDVEGPALRRGGAVRPPVISGPFGAL